MLVAHLWRAAVLMTKQYCDAEHVIDSCAYRTIFDDISLINKTHFELFLGIPYDVALESVFPSSRSSGSVDEVLDQLIDYYRSLRLDTKFLLSKMIIRLFYEAQVHADYKFSSG
jgi:hypothetical protein